MLDYKNIKTTFKALVTKTYPHGTEEELESLLPELSKDEFGNYYKIIGNNPTVMFTSHLDTYGKEEQPIKIGIKSDSNKELIYTKGNTILGADDKAGVALMLYMMSYNVDGLYYFFIGEEVGTIGSSKLSSIFEDVSCLKNINKCIGFDRRSDNSIITHQSKNRCCSDLFAESLREELYNQGLSYNLDEKGVFSDCANFMTDVSEVTNLSVGYYNEHTSEEYQDITFLEKLAKACVNINWDDLVINRKVKTANEYLRTFEGFNYKKINKKYLNDNVKIGEFYTEDEVYAYTQRIHNTYDDFIEGNLGDRIEKYENYRVEEVDIDWIELDEFQIDEGLVDEYKEKILNNKTYPIVVLNNDYSIIDGVHRLNAMNDLGYKKAIAFVGKND